MSAYVVMSHAERVLFRAIIGIDEADKLMKLRSSPLPLYNSIAMRCFALDLRGRAVDAFRRGFRAFNSIGVPQSEQPFRGTPEFDKLITIDQMFEVSQEHAAKIWEYSQPNLPKLGEADALEIFGEWQGMPDDTSYMGAFMRFVSGTATRQQSR